MKSAGTGFIFSILMLLFIGCSEQLVQPYVSERPEAIFENLWGEIDRYYPFFTDKDIDWDSVRVAYAGRVYDSMSDEELFIVLSEMVNILQDGHVNIYSPYGTSAYTDWYEQYPRNFNYNTIANYYLSHTRRYLGGNRIMYGMIGSFGYVHVNTFSGDADWVKSIDSVIDAFRELDGIIVDVRNNGGGSSANARKLAGRFADRERVFAYYQYRNGVNHSDFSDLQTRKVKPEGPDQFTKPVVLLTNRSTYSAAEDFTLAMKELPQVIHVGDTTGGGLGNPIFRELPNGWGFRVPVWRQFPVDMTTIEGIGIIPDIQIDITQHDANRLRDTIINEAIRLLSDG